MPVEDEGAENTTKVMINVINLLYRLCKNDDSFLTYGHDAVTGNLKALNAQEASAVAGYFRMND